MYIYCPDCKIEFEGDIWESGECPICEREYWWEEYWTADYDDCWCVIEWELTTKNEF